METPPPIPSQTRGNWWTRNWKWFVPTGCLTLFLAFTAFILSILLIAFGAIKSTDVYKDAIVKAKTSPAVIEALGSPIKEGMFVSGNINANGASGESDLAIPISGPKGKGTIYLKAEKSLGRWNYLELVVEIKNGGARIDLIKNPAPAAPSR
jgi:Cytochrome oxidase complex assembly protein 1